jgi:hypothetical protein
MQKKSPNEKAWQSLFDKYRIDQKASSDGFFRLTADQIRKTGREPRLMTKFDSRENRPSPLKRAGLTILPVSNGEYFLLKGDGYIDIPPVKKIERYDSSRMSTLETIQWQDGIRGESQAIDTLFMASAIKTFIGDEALQLTMRGRLRSSKFAFTFDSTPKPLEIQVEGVQIEVDAGFEGGKVVIIEAKFGSIDDFIVRQLYYPYRNLLEIGVKKEIVPILLVYSNRVYSLYQLEFPNVDRYEARVIRQTNFTLEQVKAPRQFADVEPTKTLKTPRGVPFPQADDISKVFDVTELLLAGRMRKEEIAAEFGVDPRQGDYYGNAASWLGLATKKKHQFELTSDGLRFSRMDRAHRILEVASRIKSLPAFSQAADAAIRKQEFPFDEIAKIIGKEYGYSESTQSRRAITVRAWVNWLSRELG